MGDRLGPCALVARGLAARLAPSGVASEEVPPDEAGAGELQGVLALAHHEPRWGQCGQTPGARREERKPRRVHHVGDVMVTEGCPYKLQHKKGASGFLKKKDE